MTRRICVASAMKAGCAGHRFIELEIQQLLKNIYLEFERVWNISILARAVAGGLISNLSYIGVMLIRKQRLRTHVLGREDERRDTRLSGSS